MRIKGETIITLTDVKTGKKEVHHDHNLITNALTKYLENCGYMNFPNNDESNMVEELLGGVMAFDEEITESVNSIRVPAGCKMIANGSVGTVNNGSVLEMGSYSSTESGWQDDGSYIQTYDYSTSQANGTIATVCLANKVYAYAGEGNTISNTRHTATTAINVLTGTVRAHSGIAGWVFNISLSDSSCYAFDLTDASTTGKGVLRKYRLPISKINVSGTATTPVLLDEVEVNVDSDMTGATIYSQPMGSNLIMWNVNRNTDQSGITWGNGFTQYVWTLTPAGVLTKVTLTNTSGEAISGINAAIFDGNYIFFPATNLHQGMPGEAVIDTTTIYIMDRTNGTIVKTTNTVGGVGRHTSYNVQDLNYIYAKTGAGWNLYHGSGDGRIVTTGNYPLVVDAELEAAYPTNASTATSGQLTDVDGLIRANGVNLYREIGYIASVNVLSAPIVKTAEKTMKIIYRLIFEEDNE